VNAWIAGHGALLDLFRKKQDVYRYMAGAIYNKDPADITKDERFIGKISTLGLGYGMGHKKFQTTLALGMVGPPIDLPLTECKRIVNLYRNVNKPIVDGWREGERMLRQMKAGNEGTAYNNLIIHDETSVWLPNGMPIHYPQLAISEEGDLTYNTLRGRRKLYGGKIIENLVQALARIIIIEQMMCIQEYLRTLKLTKAQIAKVVMTTHDEVVVCVPDKMAQKVLNEMLRLMRTPPEWCSDIPLDAEGGWDTCYSK